GRSADVTPTRPVFLMRRGNASGSRPSVARQRERRSRVVTTGCCVWGHASKRAWGRGSRGHRGQEQRRNERDAHGAGAVTDRRRGDNAGYHKKQAVLDWCAAQRPTVTLHWLLAHGSWLNQVEIRFSILSRKGLRRASVRSIQDLRDLMHRFIHT